MAISCLTNVALLVFLYSNHAMWQGRAHMLLAKQHNSSVIHASCRDNAAYDANQCNLSHC